MAWEYKAVSVKTGGWQLAGTVDIPKLEGALNALGAAGWELVAAFDTNTVLEGATRDVVLLLKRPRRA